MFRRVLIRLPSHNGVRTFASDASRSTTRRRVTTVSRRPSSETSLADKFNLATLNGGKSPFDVSSNRLLSSPKKQAPSVKAAKKPVREREMRDQYSLDYLMGGVSKPRKTTKNPFDVPSAKLM